jgi:hypothetical protein
VVTVAKKWKKVIATIFQGCAEGEVFNPAIGAGDGIEVGFRDPHWS